MVEVGENDLESVSDSSEYILDRYLDSIERHVGSPGGVRVRGLDDLRVDLVGARDQHHREGLGSSANSSHEVVREVTARTQQRRLSAWINTDGDPL